MSEQLQKYAPDFAPLDGTQKILLNVYRGMLEDGTIEKIARDQIADMIKTTLRDAMSYNGPVKTRFKERIEPVMISAVERSDLNSMTEKLTAVINQALQASSVGSYKEICNGLQSFCEAPTFKHGQRLKLSEMFAAYKKSCEQAFSSIYFDKDSLEADEHGSYSVYVYCKMKVEREKRYFGDGDYTVTFWPECDQLGENEEDEIINNTFSVKIHEYQGYGSDGKKRLMWYGSLDALTLRNLPMFALYLQAAKDAYCSIDIDIESDEDDVEIEIDN